MKFSTAVFMLLAATASVVVSGEDCPQKKCKSVCTLKGDPHLAKFGEKDSGFLHPRGKNGEKWINMYKHGKTEYSVKITPNGKNEYVTAVRIRHGKNSKILRAKDHCSAGHSKRKLIAGRMLKEHGVEVKCSSIKKGQYKKVADTKQKHFDVKIHRDVQTGASRNGRLLARESGRCMGKHTVKCDCNPTPAPHPKPNHPTAPPSHGPKPASPTPKPSDRPSPSSRPSCKEKLAKECGHSPEFCYKGMPDNKDCTDFLACVNKNNLGKCYTPKIPTPGPEPSSSNGTVTCSAVCSAKGDPHFTTFLGEKYKTDAAGQTIVMVKDVSDFAVEAFVDPVHDKEYITRVTFGDQVMTAEDCTNGTTVQKIDTATLQGTVECAKPNKGFEQYGYHLNVELRQKFTMPADEIESATFETFAQAMGVSADSECLSGSDDSGIAAANWSGEKLAKKFHCH